MSFLNLTEVETENFIPASIYNVIITHAEVKETRAGTGSYISITFKVMDEKYNGRVLFNIYNIDNPNPVAVEIGKADLKRLMIASKFTDFNLASVNDLLGRRLAVKVKVKEDDYGKKNVITGYSESTLSGNGVGIGGFQTTTQVPVGASGDAMPF